MKLRSGSVCVFLVLLFSVGCSKKEDSAASGTGSSVNTQDGTNKAGVGDIAPSGGEGKEVESGSKMKGR